MSEDGKGYGPWVKHPVEWAAHGREIAEVHRRMMENLMIPKSVLSSPDSNYSSAAATSAAFSARLGSAEDIEKAIRDAGEITKDSKRRSLRNAFLVVPPDMFNSLREVGVFAEADDGPVRFRPSFDYGVQMPVYRSMLLCDIGVSEPRYKPRPLPEPVQKAPAWQYAVAVAAGVLMMS